MIRQVLVCFFRGIKRLLLQAVSRRSKHKFYCTKGYHCSLQSNCFSLSRVTFLKLHSWEASRSRTRILHHTKQNCFSISIPLFLRISFYCVLKLVFFNNMFRIQNCFYWMHKHNNQRWVHRRPATPYEKTILVNLNWNLVLLQCSG